LDCRVSSAQNDMDPFPFGDPFSHLAPLLPMEIQLVAKAHPVFKTYFLPGNGDYAYTGNVCNLEQDIVVQTLFRQLPPRVEDLPHCIVRKDNRNGNHHSYKIFPSSKKRCPWPSFSSLTVSSSVPKY